MGTLFGDARPLKTSLLLSGCAAWLLISTPSTALAEEDPWLGADKAKHFGASAAIAVGGYTLSAAVFEKRSSALLIGGGLALTAGVGKELYDASGHGMASERDLVWDVAGTVTGLGLAFLVDLLIRGELDPATEPSGSSTSPNPNTGFAFKF